MSVLSAIGLEPEASDTGSVPLDYLSDTARNPLTWLALINPSLAAVAALAQRARLAKLSALANRAPRMPGIANLLALSAGQFTQPTSIFDLGKYLDEALLLSAPKTINENPLPVDPSTHGPPRLQ